MKIWGKAPNTKHYNQTKTNAMHNNETHKQVLTDFLTTLSTAQQEDVLQSINVPTLIEALEKEVKRISEQKTPWDPDYEKLTLCNNKDDLKKAIKKATDEKKILRVAGAQHSAPGAVFPSSTEQGIHVKLEGDFRAIHVLEENHEKGYLLVRVGAGCNLGVDPSDPKSNEDNSFNRTVDKKGYALPILGGMSHHTVGGFMMTSTAGGSLSHGFADVLESLEFIDGAGQERIFHKGTDEFNAAAVSMGLYGVITHVTLKLGKNYLVDGVEETVMFTDSIISTGAKFEQELKTREYVHCVWFPQEGVERVLQFIGKGVNNDEPIVPYVHVLQNKVMNYIAALVLFAVNELQYLDSDISNKIAAFLLRIVNPIESKNFRDHWFIALPNDDQALIDSVMRVQFTEIWIDVEHTEKVMAVLNDLFKKDPLAAGNFGVELYGAKASPFWMSHSYGRNVIRVDPYWWEYNPMGNLQEFFTKYWNVLLTIPTARLHWGKHFPAVGTHFGDIVIGPEYVKSAFPKFREWLKFREHFDPHQVFVTEYWRSLLGIQKS